MKEKIEPLRIYNFSHPLMMTEIFSIAGDKFANALSFSWEITTNYEFANVVLWDGIITPKNQSFVDKILKDINSGKILLLIGESMTLLLNHPGLKILKPENLNYVELAGWSILPEEILSALEVCHKKLKYV